MFVNILKVGGSILAPSEDNLFDINKAKELKETLKPFIDSGNKFILSIGGGFLARKFGNMLKDAGFSEDDRDYAGIAVINLNAVLLKSVFGDLANEEIIRYEDFEEDSELTFEKPVIIAAASIPDRSSDWDAVKLALRSHANRVVSLKNVDGVYSADPKKDQNAKFLEKLTWQEYINIIGNPTEFLPGAHFPIDIRAAKLAQENNLEFDIMGSDFNNLTNFLQGKKFKGTVIKS